MDTLDKIRENRKALADKDIFYLDRNKIIRTLEDIKILFYPNVFHEDDVDDEDLYEKIRKDLFQEITKVGKDEKTLEEFMEALPVIQERLNEDLVALYNGDPSAKTYEEIILSFPGFIATFIYRIANELYKLEVPVIPRIMAEYAHEKTGIDINPGATIGEHFCIDHGTGIVIGETAVVGDHVRMYHGVTLGVRSFRKDEFGNLLKGGKRHPNVGNNVILYANSTVLGGDTTIDDNSVVPTGTLIIQTPEKYK